MSHVIPNALIDDWNNFLKDAVPKKSKLHARNKALYFLWEDASHSRREDVEILKNLLNQRYRFEGGIFYIPLEDSQDTIRRKISEFFDESSDAGSSLALIYYSGNGTVRHSRPIWLPDSKPRPEIDWFSLQENLEASSNDVVLFVDCGYCTGSSEGAYSDVRSCFHSVSSALTGKLEILATPSSLRADDARFRKAIIDHLAKTSGEPIRIDQLRTKIHRTLGGVLDPEYVNLSRGSDRSSVTLLPSEKVNLDLTINRSLNSGNQHGLKIWAERAPWQVKTFRFQYLGDQRVDDTQKHISAVVDVAKQSDLSGKNVSSWIKLAPPYVIGISTQGSVLSIREKTGDELCVRILEGWRQSSGFHTDLTTRDGQYEKIVVLPMKWEHDGFGETSLISQELRRLCEVYETSFDHCEIKPMFEIPGIGEPQTIVTKRILEVKEGLESCHLLIVLYNGHGDGDPNRSGDCILTGQDQDSQINWNSVQPLLHEAPCDVAQILDCCYAGSAVKLKPQGRNEILAACERDVTTPAGKHSYMQRFITALKQLVGEAKPFSLLEVHERIVSETKERNDDTERRTTQAQRSEPIALPVHRLIPESSESIKLRPRVLDNAEQKAVHGMEALQDSDELLGWAYAKLPIRRGDELRDWKDVGFVKILTAEDTLKELQAEQLQGLR